MFGSICACNWQWDLKTHFSPTLYIYSVYEAKVNSHRFDFTACLTFRFLASLLVLNHFPDGSFLSLGSPFLIFPRLRTKLSLQQLILSRGCTTALSTEWPFACTRNLCSGLEWEMNSLKSTLQNFGMHLQGAPKFAFPLSPNSFYNSKVRCTCSCMPGSVSAIRMRNSSKSSL